MNRCSALVSHPLYKEYMKKNCEAEKNRRFCRHDMTHFLDTARIGYILILENNYNIEKPLIYAAALVHDIARCKETADMSHDEASARFAERILPECGFSADETARIAAAVRSHRVPDSESGTLGAVLYKADKLSRRCFMCGAYDECNWDEGIRNSSIIL